MAPIVTYAFLDLKTTGSPAEECNKTRITEISLIAVKRAHILDPLIGGSPRVQLKLSLCLNPRKAIHPQYTEETGLCNDSLEFENPFNKDVFNSIESFISLLSKPVCLLAQDGLKFDFPILKNHMINLGVTFTEDLLCADYLQGFEDVLKMKEINVSPSAGYIKNITSPDNCDVDEIDLFCLTNKVDMQVINETTPKKIISNNIVETPRKAVVTGKVYSGHSKVRRRCFWDDNAPVIIPKLKESSKLRNIYKAMFSRPCFEAHRAENDCAIALRCSVVVARQFVRWVDNNHCLFSEVKPMTIGIPLGQ